MRYLVWLLCLLSPLNSWGHGSDHHEEPVKFVDHTVSTTRGGILVLDLFENDLVQQYNPEFLTVIITSSPVEGVVSVDTKTKQITYRHGGASMHDDHFRYQVLYHDNAVSDEVTATVKFRNINAAIRIISPESGSVIAGDKIVVKYEITGKDFDHIHVNIGDSHNSVDENTGSYVLENVAPGKHTISVDLADSRHRKVNTRKSHASVVVTVVAP
ncbi:MAG: hypothetical protein KTR32_42655 [Granulosicoccus sp.]|nr:hypothetical protein [Granulosicoccus sp.]